MSKLESDKPVHVPGSTEQPQGDWWRAVIMPVGSSDREPQRSLREVLAPLVRSWPWILAFGTVGLVAGFGGSLLLQPTYRSSVMVAIAPPSDGSLGASLGGSLGGLASLAGFNIGQSDRSQEAIAFLRSRSLADAFIRQEGLTPVLFRQYWDDRAQKWVMPDGRVPPSPEDAYLRFDKKMRNVSEDRRTGLVTIAFSWSDPSLAAKWANSYVGLANAALRERSLAESKASLDFLQRELRTIEIVEVRQAIYQLIEAQKKQQMLATVRPEFAYRVVDPAVPSDPENFRSPNRPLLAAAGLLLGALLGAAFGVWRRMRRARPDGA